MPRDDQTTEVNWPRPAAIECSLPVCVEFTPVRSQWRQHWRSTEAEEMAAAVVFSITFDRLNPSVMINSSDEWEILPISSRKNANQSLIQVF